MRRRTGSLSACSTAASSSSPRCGCGRVGVVVAICASVVVRRSSYIWYGSMIIVQGGVMQERKLPAERVAAARRRQLQRRAKRGVVAGYIHELSVRHQHGG